MNRVTAAILASAALALAASDGAQAATRQVDMGPPPPVQRALQPFQADVNAFFPTRTTIRVGDSVRFVPYGFHDVDLLPRGARGIPLLSPTGQPVSGATDAAGAPFWFNGQPQLGFTPSLLSSNFGKRLRFDGSARVLSGLPVQERPRPMTVRFTKAGRYTYLCDVHPGMKGSVRVVGFKRKVPTARAHARAGAAQAARAVTVARGLASTTPPAGTVFIGAAGSGGVESLAFFPRTLSVATGTTVRFAMSPRSYETHTATSGPGDPDKDPSSYLGQLAASFAQPVLNPAAVYPSDPPTTTPTLSPTTHGNGFWSTGALDVASATPLPASGSVTFTTPGTYEVYCLIHPFMHGTVVVV